MVSFGERLKRLRLNKNLTQTRVGDLLGVSSKAISRYENDQAEPSIDLIKKFSKLYEVDYNYLFDYKNKYNYNNSNINYYLNKDELLLLNQKERELLKNMIKSMLNTMYLTDDNSIKELNFVNEDDSDK